MARFSISPSLALAVTQLKKMIEGEDLGEGQEASGYKACGPGG